MSQKDKWESVLKDYEESGLSQSSYARQIGINESRLRYWKRKLSKESSNNTDKSNFIKITKEEKIELLFGEVTVKLPVSISETKLVELIKCLN